MNVHQHQMSGGGGFHRLHRAMSLLEVLVVVAIAAALAGIVVPTLGQSRLRAKVLRAHADLRQVGLALDAYMLDYRDKVPPTRCGCSLNVQYQLPVELAACNYLPRAPGLVPQADFPDVFNPASTYKYLAPGPIWVNGTYFDFPNSTSKPRASIWVPDDFPGCASAEGRYLGNRKDEPRSPVVYAVWSVGPDTKSPKFPRSGSDDVIDESRFPLPKAYWFRGSSDRDGLITRFRARTGAVYDSP